MRDKRKLLCGLVSLLVVLGLAIPLLPTVVSAQPAIEIWDWYDLDAVRTNLSGSYALMTNLDSATAGYDGLAGSAANGGKGWDPIGSGYDRFGGAFDGQGHEIGDLFVDCPAEDNVGLFAAIGTGGWIENTGVVNVTVIGDEWVGGLWGGCGSIYCGGTVTNCYSTGSVNGTLWVGGLGGDNGPGTARNSYSTATVVGETSVGGLVGHNDHGTISNCFSSGNVVGDGWVGGLAGYSSHGIVGESYATGDVTGRGIVGGLIGLACWDNTVIDSYSTGSVGASNRGGGLVGWLHESVVSRCYSSGSVHCSDMAGGLVGHIHPEGTVNNSFWDIQTSGKTTSAGGTGKTTAEMKNIATFLGAGWDIETTTLGDPIGGYPFLSWQLHNSPVWLMYGGAVGWETYPTSRGRVLLPWTALFAIIIAGASLLVLKHRHS